MAKVVFCQRVVYAFFGTMSISAMLKKHGHEVELVMDADIENNVREILKLKPDIVAFSTITASGEFEWALETVSRLKAAGNRIISVLGNLHPTLFPEESIKEEAVDIICRGEGEYAMLELSNSIDANTSYTDIAGLWIKEQGRIARNPLRPLIDLDELPFPDRELYQKYGYFNKPSSIDVLAGRGCVFDCSYCYNQLTRKLYNSNSKFARKHSVGRVVTELTELKLKYNPKSFTFVDEYFTIDRKWIAEFSEKYSAHIGLPFVCNIQAASADEDTIAALAKAGVSKVCFGLESGNEKIRKEILNKNIGNDQIIACAKLLHKYGIKFLTANILGLPGESVDNALETVTLNRLIKTDYLYFSIFQPYPGLKISKYCLEKGLLPNMENASYDSTYFKNSPLVQKDIRRLVNLHKLFYLAVKTPVPLNFLKLIIKLPANFIFDLIFISSFGWMQLKCFCRSPRQLLRMGTGNLKVFYSPKQNGASL
ncbi:MAG: radical SAM protein [Elusimicrobiota bacterium]